MLSYNFSWCFQTPPRTPHEPLTDFVPMSCMECHSPSTKWQLTSQSYHTPSNFKLKFMSRTSEPFKTYSEALHQIWPKLPLQTGVFYVYNIQDHSLTAASDCLLSELLQPLPPSHCHYQCTRMASLLVVLAGAARLPNLRPWAPPHNFPIELADLQSTGDACSDLSTHHYVCQADTQWFLQEFFSPFKKPIIQALAQRSLQPHHPTAS